MTRQMRWSLSILLSIVPLIVMTFMTFTASAESLVIKTSPHDVKTTVDRLETAISSRGAVVVAKVDHAAAAQAIGLSLRPTVLVLFVNPKLGTPLMQSQQTVGLDLPLRVLIWQDADGTTRVGYTNPAVIASGHGITDRNEVVDKMSGALAAIVDETTSK